MMNGIKSLVRCLENDFENRVTREILALLNYLFLKREVDSETDKV